MIEILAFAGRPVDYLLHGSAVFRMDPFENMLHGRFRRWVILEDPESFLRPKNLSVGDIPAEAAGAAQCLGVPEIGFTASKNGFGRTRCLVALAGRSRQAGLPQQGDEDQTDEAGCRQVEPEAEANKGQQCQTDGTEDSLWE